MRVQTQTHHSPKPMPHLPDNRRCQPLWLALALMAGCTPLAPEEAVLKAALVHHIEEMRLDQTMTDAITFCVGIRDGADGGDPKAAYNANAGYMRDPERSFIHSLQRETLRGNPIFKSFSDCGGRAGSVMGKRIRMTIEGNRLIDSRHARVEFATRWGPDGRWGYYTRSSLEKGDHGWRVTKEW
jgi:hypothetical protein